MNREEIIQRIKQYFDIRELVGPDVYYAHYDNSWQFLDTEALHCLLIVREGIGLPIIVNNWHKYDESEWSKPHVYTERGLRVNIGKITSKRTRNGVLYLSAHLLGKAFDFKVMGMHSDDVRAWIYTNASLFPCKVRLENKITKTGKTITWVHLDIMYLPGNPKVYLFNI